MQITTNHRTVSAMRCTTRRILITAGTGLCAAASLSISLGAQSQQRDTAARQAARDSVRTHAITIDGRTLNAVPAFTLEQTLQGRVAGMVVTMNDGAPWSDGQIQIRGASTLIGDPSPLVIVDGVQTTNAFSALTGLFSPQGELPRFVPTASLSAFTPFEIERVEVLKGPAATSLYGARGAVGVLLITTRRAASGAAHWRAMVRTGAAEAMRLPASRCFASVGAAIAATPADSVGIRNSAASNGGTLPCRAQFAEYFSAQAMSSEAAVQWSGRLAGTGLLGSATRKDAPGSVAGSGATRTNLRLNLDRAITERLSVQVSSGLSLTDITRGGGSSQAASSLLQYPSWRDARREGPTIFGTSAVYSPYTWLRDGRDDGTATRTTGSVILRYDAIRRAGMSLRIEAVTGLDRSSEDDDQAVPVPNVPNPFVSDSILSAFATRAMRSRMDNHVVRARLETSYAHGLPLTVETGVTLDRQSFDVARSEGVPGVTLGSDSVFARNSMTGMYASVSTALLQQALELGASVRSDRIGEWGGVRGTYPSVQLRYHVPMPSSGIAMDVHGAWGVSGSLGAMGTRPTLLGSFDPFNPVIPPFERRTDLEGGVDLRRRDGRLTLSYTAYRSRIGALYAANRFPGSNAVVVLPDQASMRTTGHELTLATQLLARRNASWYTRVTVTRTSSQLTSYNLPVAIESFLPTISLGPSQFVGPGVRLGAITIIGDRAIAQGSPSFDAAGANTIRVGPITLHTLLDWRQGGTLYSATLRGMDINRTSADFDAPSPVAGTPLGVYRRNALLTGDSTGVFLTPGSYVRLREVALRYAVPARWSSPVFGSAGLALSVSARNLAIWSKSVANDPEFSGIGTHPYARVVDRLRYPTMRQVFVGVELGM